MSYHSFGKSRRNNENEDVLFENHSVSGISYICLIDF